MSKSKSIENRPTAGSQVDQVKIDLEQIRELLSVVSSTDITELTIESGDQRITVKKERQVVIPQVAEVAQPVHVTVPVAASAAPAPAPAQTAKEPPAKAATPEQNGAKEEANNGWVPITSPMVGTFYRAASPTAAPFVNIGDRVNVGQTVCIIEAMKLMNDMPAEVAGKIVKVCVENGTTVEYGQPLFLVDTKG